MTEDIIKFESRSDVPAPLPIVLEPAEIISHAVQKGYSLEQLQQVEKMLELQKKHDAYQAEKAFYAAVAEFNKNAPEVFTDKNNKQYEGSAYSSLPNYLSVVNPVLAIYGLTVKFVPSQVEKVLSITCVLRHELGHSESVTMSGPPDDSGKKNTLQQIKSTFTYLRVVTFESVLGIAAIDGGTLDDDGNAAGGKVVEYISEKQLSEIVDTINEHGLDEVGFLAHMVAKSCETIPAKDYDKAKAALKRKVKSLEREPGDEDDNQ